MSRRHAAFALPKVPSLASLVDDISTAKFLAKNNWLFHAKWDPLVSSNAPEHQRERTELGKLFWTIGSRASRKTLAHWVSPEGKEQLTNWCIELISTDCSLVDGAFHINSHAAFAWFHVLCQWAKDDVVAILSSRGGEKSLVALYVRVLLTHIERPLCDYMFNLVAVTIMNVVHVCAANKRFSMCAKAGSYNVLVALAERTEGNADLYERMMLSFCSVARAFPADTARYLGKASSLRERAEPILSGNTANGSLTTQRGIAGLIQMADWLESADEEGSHCDNCIGKKALYFCSFCVGQRYCDRYCQRQTWEDHKQFCAKTSKPNSRSAFARTAGVMFSKFVEAHKREIGSKIAAHIRQKNLAQSSEKVEGLQSAKRFGPEDVVVLLNFDRIFGESLNPLDEIVLKLRQDLLSFEGVPSWLGVEASSEKHSGPHDDRRVQCWKGMLTDDRFKRDVLCFYLAPGFSFYAGDFLSCDLGIGSLRITTIRR